MASQIETRLSIAIITLAHTTELAAAEYVKDPSNPQRYWNYQQARWEFNGHAMGVASSDVVVSDIPWTKDQMRKFMGVGRFGRVSNPDFAFYLPEIASTEEGLKLLAKAYPWMGWTEGYIQDIQNVYRDGSTPALLSGHLRTEAAINAPYTNTNEDKAREILARLGRRGHTINT